jgi:hypothetical protein
LDPKQLIERVDATEAAIHGRLRDLQYDSDPHQERQLMEDAQRTLMLRSCVAVLKRCRAMPTKAGNKVLEYKPE